ncbi:hypothetical protein ATANTOWER_022838 [Ataeniobius toweri]|uniref:Uncharacterized protein n=1 Tax=Ataeniobius toweri TaxID=208326 RepID=A0ABU7AZC9_9TELE|nr:hypothetical protein [Ataeniobius toweri]
MQHLASNSEGPRPPQQVQSALSLLVDGFKVASPLQSVVQVNTEVFILLHHLQFFSHDGNRVDLFLFFLKSSIISFVLFTFKMRGLLSFRSHDPMKQNGCEIILLDIIDETHFFFKNFCNHN